MDTERIASPPGLAAAAIASTVLVVVLQVALAAAAVLALAVTVSRLGEPGTPLLVPVVLGAVIVCVALIATLSTVPRVALLRSRLRRHEVALAQRGRTPVPLRSEDVRLRFTRWSVVWEDVPRGRTLSPEAARALPAVAERWTEPVAVPAPPARRPVSSVLWIVGLALVVLGLLVLLVARGVGAL